MTDDFERGFEAGYEAAGGRRDDAEDEKKADGMKPIRSLEDVRKLNTDEVNERWSEVQAVLGGQR